MDYNKLPKTHEEHLDILRQRNLKIDDEAMAKYYLANIGYYRLSAYYTPFQQKEDIFCENVSFNDILSLYVFDRQLRLILLDALERVEVALRSKISNYLSINAGAHWYLDSNHFNNTNIHNSIILKMTDDINNSKAVAVKHYQKKYDSPELPPSWVVFEELSIGTISRIFKAIKNNHKNNIAHQFSISSGVLESWLFSLTILRNKCAHHSRVWNATYPAIKVPKKEAKLDIQTPTKMQALSCIVAYLVEQISDDTNWHNRYLQHLETCPIKYQKSMGYLF